MHSLKDILFTAHASIVRDMKAKGQDMKAKTPRQAFTTRQERDEFNVEIHKNCVLGDLRALEAEKGPQYVKAWLLDAYIDKPMDPHGF